MEKKNKRLLILVAILLVSIGVSLAYFVSSTKINGNGALVDVTTSEINGAEVKVEGILNFDDTNIYPGHKNVASVKVTATGDNELIPYNLIWSGTNTVNTSLNYTVYKTNTPVDTNANCTKKTEVIGGMQALSEECTISNIEALGTSISTGSINKGDTKVTLVNDEFITATPSGEIKYYYIILEYPNLDTPQNEDINGVLNGKIYAEESNTKPDVNILATYVIQDNGEYQQVDDIPQSGYVINTSKSTCSNGAIPGWDIKTSRFYVDNLTISGTSCYLYFDKYTVGDYILANITPKTTTPDFSQVATTDEGVFKAEDGMYGSTEENKIYTYYWRGAVENNYVKFGGFCWRIIRINGDKTIRLIYDGSSCHANGTSTTESIAVTKQAYNPTYNASYYAGWTYEVELQRPIDNLTAINSNAKTQIESWYDSNLSSYATLIANGKYCNDRDVGQPLSSWGSGYGTSWSATGTTFAYAGVKRLYESYSPTFNCPSDDVYTLKVGAITADEVAFAGGNKEYNRLYYLYNGQNYWTISPYIWFGGGTVYEFYVDSNGLLNYCGVNNTDIGLRPVINLKSDVTFSSGNGSLEKPYVVEGAE